MDNIPQQERKFMGQSSLHMAHSKTYDHFKFQAPLTFKHFQADQKINQTFKWYSFRVRIQDVQNLIRLGCILTNLSIIFSLLMLMPLWTCRWTSAFNLSPFTVHRKYVLRRQRTDIDRSHEYDVTGSVANICNATLIFGNVNLSIKGRRDCKFEERVVWKPFHVIFHMFNSFCRKRGSSRSSRGKYIPRISSSIKRLRANTME